MAFEVNYKVHRVAPGGRTAGASLDDGTRVHADIPLLEVHLTDEKGHHGSLTLRMHTPEDRQYGADNFKEGDTVKVSFEKVTV